MSMKRDEAEERAGSGVNWVQVVFWSAIAITVVPVLAMPVGRWFKGVLLLMLGW